jgi:hypothetical protein
MAQYPLIPGYGGGDMAGSSLPDGSGIAEALARNAQLGAEKKPKFDIGQFLLAWAGHLGDNLTGSPVYASTLKDKAAAEADARSAEAQKAWWYEQQRYQAENRPKDKPGVAEEFEWFNSLPPEMKKPVGEYMQMRYPGMQAPQMIPYGYEQVGGGQPAGPPAGENIPTLSSPEQAASLPPGSRFRTPDGRIKIVPGGPTGSAPSGGFL